MVTRAIYTLLVSLVAAQRALELRRSRRNEAFIRARGGREHAAWQMPFMRALHAGWLASTLLEVWLTDRPFEPALAAVAAVAFVAGQALRRAAMKTLGPRWTVRVMTIPGAPPIKRGIYARIRHPNYLGVALEIAALPLIHSAYITAIVFTFLNALLMHWRIRAEEAALRGADGARRVRAP